MQGILVDNAAGTLHGISAFGLDPGDQFTSAHTRKVFTAAIREIRLEQLEQNLAVQRSKKLIWYRKSVEIFLHGPSHKGLLHEDGCWLPRALSQFSEPGLANFSLPALVFHGFGLGVQLSRSGVSNQGFTTVNATSMVRVQGGLSWQVPA
ncbi:hypothetical protein [Glutamicibacter sp. HZAU]|uniref:hypothetical protein n=1 Tax=Glutamicibacter sp. HZAU TaxID=2049891 RepID=UPI000FFB1654|nr:hypothetical protein [Glutamicibacter sp. HZAU]RWZ83314.1 hypothetical protein EKH49_09055 [Glutamicibacter sp. HZAU]